MVELSGLMRKELNRAGLSSPDKLPADNSCRIRWKLAQHRDRPFHSLRSLYILADAVLVQSLKDPVITALIGVYGHYSPGKKRGQTLLGNGSIREFRDTY